ncbi:SLBB domain-containing protein [Dactylosporangium sp. NBC_01737]|uniref:NADH-ubiquinone oxidoreductase-F iron-sulfur binding region domain-containing protein n=1 Tax=Dactylosporangium sp. NBC_01737 TaxID=2975959 RepID=UPI002E0DD45D|nr:SLBB domain-containing protein [Dactylosporangium sp. NBC_01737]
MTAGRLLGAAHTDLRSHAAAHGPLPRPPQEALIGAVRDAGLTGHGGAGFPTHLKLAAVRGHAGGRRTPVVVGNGAEGEPGSAKDRTLLEHSPHLVLDGLQLAAAAVGAAKAYLYVRQASAGHLARAVEERRAAGWDRVPVAVHRAQETFLSGEESAVVAALGGGRAVPRDKLRRVTESGVGGAPTLVQNVETLAHVALVARHGAGWFRQVGTAREPGTFLATVSGPVAAPGVHEVPHGVALGELLAAAGGPVAPLRAVLVGGFHGAWVPAPLAGVPMSREGLAPYGASPGAGVVVPLAVGECGLARTAQIAGYLAAAGAKQCGPCRNGLPRLAETLAALARMAGDRELPAGVARLAALVHGRGACGHPDGTVRLIRSAMTVFADDVTAHLHGTCLEGARR